MLQIVNRLSLFLQEKYFGRVVYASEEKKVPLS